LSTKWKTRAAASALLFGLLCAPALALTKDELKSCVVLDTRGDGSNYWYTDVTNNCSVAVLLDIYYYEKEWSSDDTVPNYNNISFQKYHDVHLKPGEKGSAMSWNFTSGIENLRQAD
jgi:hypothetical protein